MVNRLHLNDDVYFCITEGQGVFLDLAQDAYSAVPIPSELMSEGGQVSEVQLMTVFAWHQDDLLREQLLTTSASSGRDPLDYRSITRPKGHIFGEGADRAFGLTGAEGRAVRIRTTDVRDFFLASRQASRWLAKRHIHDIVKDVRARKAAHSRSSANEDELRRETMIFRKLRPWYARPYSCLFDGLALVEYLARRGLFPTWVFGVQAQPFGAHCWVQDEERLLNESEEYAGQFTPIMAV